MPELKSKSVHILTDARL